jgi:DNA (cytosine-5)-methyltransferase 1
MYPKVRPIAVDLFSGAGGMSLGFEQAGFDVVFAVDRDPYHVAAHARNFPACITVCKSITEITGQDIRKLASITGDIDLVFGGPPCQGFSHMGLRDIADPRNTLVDEFARIVEELRPRTFVMENVPGMRTGATKSIFDRVVLRLRKMGYSIPDPQRLNAAAFGVPQQRERLFVVGIREDLQNAFCYPVGPSIGQPATPNVRDALDGLPNIEGDERLYREEIAVFDTMPSSGNRYALIARGLETDASDASRPRVWDRTRVSGCFRTRHRADVSRLYAATLPGEVVPGHKLPRLHPDGLSPTLRAGSESERGAHTAPRPIHPFFPRCITVREAARLHGYPDWFAFYPTKWHAYRQVGNSVCPPVARAVGKELLEVLGCELTSEVPQPVVLADNFELPAQRPKHAKRVVRSEQLPKVVNYLFNSLREKGDNVSALAFDVKQIQSAMEHSGAELPQITPESFLDNLARSRNLLQMIAHPVRYGYTIRITPSGGEFVPIGTSGAIDQRDTISIRSDELTAAHALAMEFRGVPGEQCKLFSVLRHAEVSRLLFGQRTRIEYLDEPDGQSRRRFCRIKRGSVAHGIVVLAEGGNLPTMSRFLRMMIESSVSLGVLIAAVTAEHVFVAAFRQRNGNLSAVSRRAFRLTEERN